MIREDNLKAKAKFFLRIKLKFKYYYVDKDVHNESVG